MMPSDVLVLARKNAEAFAAQLAPVLEGKASAAELLSLRVKDAPGLVAFAVEMVKEDALEDAEAAAELAVAADPNSFDGWMVLGATRARLKRERDALLAYAKAAELNPNNARLWCDVGELKLQLLDYTGAAQALKFALQADPKGETLGGRRAQGLIAKTFAKIKEAK